MAYSAGVSVGLQKLNGLPYTVLLRTNHYLSNDITEPIQFHDSITR